MKSLGHVRIFATPWTVAYKAPLSMEFSGQESWSGLPFPSPGDLPDPGIKPGLPSEPSPTIATSASRISTGCCHDRLRLPHRHQHKQQQQDFPGGRVVKMLPCNAGNVLSASAQGAKSPRAVEPLSPCPATRGRTGHSERFRTWQLRSGTAKQINILKTQERQNASLSPTLLSFHFCSPPADPRFLLGEVKSLS